VHSRDAGKDEIPLVSAWHNAENKMKLRGYWQDPSNQRSFLDSLAVELGVRQACTFLPECEFDLNPNTDVGLV